MGFVQDLDLVTEEVSDWAVGIIEDVTGALNPEGTPYGMVELTPEEQIEEYLSLRGDPNAWYHWILEKVSQILQKLQTSGLKPEDIASVHPYEIATRYAIEYSARMEETIAGR